MEPKVLVELAVLGGEAVLTATDERLLAIPPGYVKPKAPAKANVVLRPPRKKPGRKRPKRRTAPRSNAELG